MQLKAQKSSEAQAQGMRLNKMKHDLECMSILENMTKIQST